MENINTIHFRKAGNSVIAVTETNTKVTYISHKQYDVGRFVIEFDRILIRKTAIARINYFMYNNRLARFKRAILPAIQRLAARFGVQLYMSY